MTKHSVDFQGIPRSTSSCCLWFYGWLQCSTLAYPTLVLHDGVAELAAASRRDLGVVPAQQLKAAPVRLVLQVEVRHGVETVVGEVLRGTVRQHLQEPYLVAVCLVVDLEQYVQY